jgi:hypothetical protein
MSPEALGKQVSNDLSPEEEPAVCPFSEEGQRNWGDALVAMMCFLFVVLLLILSFSMM